MYLYFVRHGESEGNKLGVMQGWRDFPLTSLGKNQAKKVARYIKEKQLTFDYMYSSDLTRAYQTAKIIAENNQWSLQQWEKLREVHIGPFEGMTREEIYTNYPQAKANSLLTSGVAGTEAVSEITARCKYILEQMKLAHDGKHIALVSHGGFITIMLMYILLGDNWHLHHRPFKIDNTSITLIEFKNDRRPIIHYINKTTHLELEELQQEASPFNREA